MLKISALGILALVAPASIPAAENFKAEGVVNAIKSNEQKLNITHGPVAGLMSGMTMDFTVQDPLLLNEVKPGSKISFTLTKDGRGNIIITDLEPILTTTTKK